MPIYMQYEEITGSVTAKEHKGWIEITSAQLGNTKPAGLGSNIEAAAPSVSEITITKSQDENSTALFREAINGVGKKVTIDFVNNKGVAYMRIELEEVLISSYTVSGHGGDARDKPVESFLLNSTKIKSTAFAADTPKDPKSKVQQMDWDVATSNDSE